MIFTEKILSRVSPVWGVCPFNKLGREHLIECRAIQRLPENPQTIIVFAFPYLLPEDKYDGLNVSKYAAVPDYHGIVGARLEKAAEELRAKYPGEEFVYFADNSPIPEVSAAVLAGIGVRGANSLLITPEYGSFVVLGEIVTSMKIETEAVVNAGCTGCGACERACPVGAIKGGVIDTEKCLSRVTQKKGELTEEEKELIRKSGCAWGCDICQNVCPMNKNAVATGITEFTDGVISGVDESTPIEGRAFAWRGEKVIRRNLKIIENSGEDNL